MTTAVTNPPSTALAAGLFVAAFNTVYEDDPWMTVAIHRRGKTEVSVTGELTAEYAMRFPVPAVDALLTYLADVLARGTAAVLSVTLRGREHEAEAWAWHLPMTRPLTVDEVPVLLGSDVHHADMRFHYALTGSFGVLDCVALTEDVRALLYRRGIADYKRPRSAIRWPAGTKRRTGDVLTDALQTADVACRTDSDGSAEWVAVDLACGATIQISCHGSIRKYPGVHSGWVARFYPDGSGSDRFTEIYATVNTDLISDTAAVVKAVTECMRQHGHEEGADRAALAASQAWQLETAHAAAQQARHAVLAAAAAYVADLLRPHLPSAAGLTVDGADGRLRVVRGRDGSTLWSAPCAAVSLPGGVVADVEDALRDALMFGVRTALLPDAGWTGSDLADDAFDVLLPQT
ncbi:hypothetical protein ACFV3E_40895 [Streptomyces sp. NPDC059718]